MDRGINVDIEIELIEQGLGMFGARSGQKARFGLGKVWAG